MNDTKKLAINSVIYTLKSIVGLLFPLITFPYTSNVLGAENIGKVEYANSITSYFIFFAGLGITTYAVREGAKVREDRAALSQFAMEMLTINIASSILAYLGLFLVCNIPAFRPFRYLIIINSVSILFAAMGMEWIYNLKEQFVFITIRYLIVHIIAIVFLFVFVRTSDDYYYYAIYISLANCGANLINSIYLKKHIDFRTTHRLSLSRHIKPLFLLFSISVTATLYANMDTTMLGYIRGEKDVGIYQAGIRINHIAETILASISTVFFSRSCFLIHKNQVGHNTEFFNLIKGFNGFMMMISMPICIGLFSISYYLIGWLLSSEYSASSIVLMISSFNLINSVISRVFGHQVLICAGKDMVYFISIAIALIINVTINYFLIPSLGYIATAISTVAGCAVSSIIILCYTGFIIKIKSMMLDSAKYLLFCLPFLLISFMINKLVLPDSAKCIFVIAACIVIYGLALFISKDPNIVKIIKLVLGDKKKCSTD